jgi:hypothetical protein
VSPAVFHRGCKGYEEFFLISHSATATRAWARKAVEWFSYEIGADASHVIDISEIIGGPEKHSAWGTRETGDVGGPVLQ